MLAKVELVRCAPYRLNRRFATNLARRIPNIAIRRNAYRDGRLCKCRIAHFPARDAHGLTSLNVPLPLRARSQRRFPNWYPRPITQEKKEITQQSRRMSNKRAINESASCKERAAEATNRFRGRRKLTCRGGEVDVTSKGSGVAPTRWRSLDQALCDRF